MSKYAFAAAAALSALIASSAAMAASPTVGTEFTVKVNVEKGCTITTGLGAVDFGSASASATKPVGTSANGGIQTAKFACNTDYGFHLTSANYADSTFNMVKSGGGKIPYTISVGGNTLGNTAVTTFSQSAATTDVTFTFAITKWDTSLAIGQYQDNVTLNVDF